MKSPRAEWTDDYVQILLISPERCTTRFPPTVRVLGMLIEDGHVIQFSTRSSEVRLLDKLSFWRQVVKAWIDDVRNRRLYVLQYDSVTSNTTHVNQEYIPENPYNHITLNLRSSNPQVYIVQIFFFEALLEWILFDSLTLPLRH